MYKKIFHCISWWEKSDVGCRMFGVWFWMLDVRGWMSEVGCWEITKTSGIVLQASGIKMRGRSQVLGVGNQMLRDYKIIGYQVTVNYVYNLVQ